MECVTLLQMDPNAWKTKLHFIFFMIEMQIGIERPRGKPEIYFKSKKLSDFNSVIKIIKGEYIYNIMEA